MRFAIPPYACWLENLPTEGLEALVERTDTPSFGVKQPVPAE